MLKKLGDNNWKERKDALEELEKVLTANNSRIKLDGLYDLIAALKPRLADSNKTLVKGFLAFIGRFCEVFFIFLASVIGDVNGDILIYIFFSIDNCYK